MEAPDNIYLFKKPNDVILGTWFLDSNEQFENIEYIRKDAFIEKACKYLKENATYTHPRKGTEECIINIPKFIEYIKGE